MSDLLFSVDATLPVFLVMVAGWLLGRRGFLPRSFCAAAEIVLWLPNS